eukprot:271403-Pleurochrysis_carterae.AAC.1
MWCEGDVANVADGTSDKKSERARTLLAAGAIQFKWPEDAERDEPEIRMCKMHGSGHHASSSVLRG